LAEVNSKIFVRFEEGKLSLLKGTCPDAKRIVQEITNLMTVPLVQGTLRYAHIQDKLNQKTEKAEAEGATFAAAVLPILHACNEQDAKTVYDNMRVGNGKNAQFELVKGAFERNYGCMGITCKDVGGILSADNESYFDGAGPCTDAPSAIISGTVVQGLSLAAGLTTAIFVALLM
jgi:hypothetical protein